MKKISVLLVSSLLIFSCKKNNTPKPAPPDCLLQYVVGTGLAYSEKVNYGTGNIVLGVEETGGSYTSLVPYADSMKRVSRIDYFYNTNIISEKFFNFDANNRTILITTYQNGGVSQYQGWAYTNNTSTRPSEEKVYTINNGNQALSATNDYTYDSHGNVLTMVSKTFDTQGNVLTTDNTSFTYDSKPDAEAILSFMPDVLAGNTNNITSQVTKDSGGNITASINSTYTYDSNGNVSQRQDVNNFGVSSTYIYTFLCH